ncbi:MAG: succinate dehydrogenase assembly factor 2 [Celeribacter sp.]|jgi:antitoxin CptB
MRSMRRGIKEMDLVLSAYSRAQLDQMSDADLALYDQLLEENDQDLLRWITGMDQAPEQFAALVADISARGRTW